MTRPAWVPDELAADESGACLLLARPRHLPALVRAGLRDPATWDRACAAGAFGGRGRTGTIEVDPSLVLRVKRMRRGGITRGLWRDRFFGVRRLVANLTVPLAALRRGVATVEPIGLLVERGPLGLQRGWLATTDVTAASSLAERLASPTPPASAELVLVLALIRGMHDRGVDHRDLNLGNVLLRPTPAGLVPLVIDLDRARLHAGPLPFRLRARALCRLERSSVKLFGRAPRRAGIDLRRVWYEAYAAGDPALAARLDRARRRNRVCIALHGWTWRRRREAHAG